MYGMLKSLTNLVISNDTTEKPVASLLSGQFFKIFPYSKLKEELIFKDSSLEIVKATQKNHYLLRVDRIFEEGEEELINEKLSQDDGDDSELNDEVSFLIGRVKINNSLNLMKKKKKELFFHKVDNTLQWIDPLDSSSKIAYKYVPDSEKDIAKFENLLYRCMFETVYKVDQSSISQRDISDFRSVLDDDLKLFIEKKKPVIETPTKPSNPATPVASVTAKEKNNYNFVTKNVLSEKNICQKDVEFFMYSTKSQSFQSVDKGKASIIDNSSFNFSLLLTKNGSPHLLQDITPAMNPIFRTDEIALIWNWIDPVTNSANYSWLIQFESKKDLDEFRLIFAKCLYESLNKGSFDKMNKEDRNCLVDSYLEDEEMDSVESDESDSEAEQSSNQSNFQFNIDYDSDEEQDYARNQLKEDASAKNSQLIVGYKEDRCFVVRGDKIGVFKNTEDNLEFSTTITNVRTMQNQNFSPKNLMLHRKDSQLLMKRPGDDYTIHKMDLEYGKIVEEYKANDMPILDFTPTKKYSQTSLEDTFIGFNNKSIFRLDPRVSGEHKVVTEENKNYITNYNFTAAATTGNGELVVGSETGELRFYNKLGNNAVNRLIGLGEPILGVDSTENGKYLIATCKDFLIFVATEVQDKKNCFTSTLKLENRPKQVRLQLKPEDVQNMKHQGPISFTKARFNQGVGLEEKSIVTSTGPYVVTWNFRRVKQGKLYDYRIKCYTEEVVADNFKFNQDQNIIVALPQNVEMVGKGKLMVS
ncbi:hypothetical protein HK099_000162 [Clydaea vesicula]|uniref:Uncharacterized protein n=1 Tax=Clydaea vesicula TaxID=447962 RepID=A0AAD5XSZ1_9FUNG|nr:hypothetical protein HK099_000162 [Clydaea vesicula]